MFFSVFFFFFLLKVCLPTSFVNVSISISNSKSFFMQGLIYVQLILCIGAYNLHTYYVDLASTYLICTYKHRHVNVCAHFSWPKFLFLKKGVKCFPFLFESTVFLDIFPSFLPLLCGPLLVPQGTGLFLYLINIL